MFTDLNDEFDNFISTKSVKCPNCAANIFFNEKIGKLVCGACGGLYEPETLAPSGRFENRDISEAGEEEENKQEFICDSCGAALVTDYNTAATFCGFCGSPTLIKKRLSKSFRPDLIIPFKVSKEEAIENFRAWAKTNKGIPKEFVSDATLSKITGYYVPFWLIDADCHAAVGGSGKIVEKGVVANFFIDRDVKFQVRKVPFDGCKKISNLLMEAIEPFDYSELRPYNDMYLPGFYAQRYDQSALDMLDIIKIRIDMYAAGAVKHFTTREYQEVDVSSTGSYADNFSQLYALLPVWFLNVKYKGINYGIAVNGQTGEASGNLPIKKSRVYMHAIFKSHKWLGRYLAFTSIFPIFISTWMIYGYMQGEHVKEGLELFDYQLFLGFFLVIWFCAVCFGLPYILPVLKAKIGSYAFNESVTIDKAPGVEEYIDFQSKFEMVKNDTFSCMTTRSSEEKSDVETLEALYTSKRLLRWIFKD